MRRNELVIRIALPRWSRGRWIAVATGLVMVGAAIAWAAGPLYTPPDTKKPGDALTAAYFNDAFAKLSVAINALDARTSGRASCPPGYDQDTTVTAFTVCRKGTDEMVKVGKEGMSVFWIDRYEASVWDRTDPNGIQYGTVDGTGSLAKGYPSTFPQNGQRQNFVDLYAMSKAGVQPSGSLTWFQAQQACRASGKRLPTDEEWLAAASGTPDRPWPATVRGSIA